MALNIAINSLLLLLFKWQKTVSFIEMGSVFNWVNFISCSSVHGWEKWAAFLSSTTYQTPPPVVNFPLSWKWLIENKMFNSGLFEIKGKYINALFIFMYIQLYIIGTSEIFGVDVRHIVTTLLTTKFLTMCWQNISWHQEQLQPTQTLLDHKEYNM